MKIMKRRRGIYSLPKGDTFSFHLQLNGGTFTHINHLTEEYNQT